MNKRKRRVYKQRALLVLIAVISLLFLIKKQRNYDVNTDEVDID